jgi:glycosyltransferase involved in cell wall biosynthesis
VPVKVSVIVATYNSGNRIQTVFDALDAQSLPPHEFEAIFVDDGSTDDTYARLLRAAEERAHFSVQRIENSGWPGRPRNIGLDAAVGEYVLFMDHDDSLFPQALARVSDFGTANSADLVLAKEVTTGAPTVGWPTFRHQIEHTTDITDATLALLTPHKFYRREFLAEHGIRFKEGRIRLEDYLFNYQVFAAAPRISVLADYPTYHWIHHGTQNTHASFDQDMYWGVFAETVDVVASARVTETVRDRLYLRLYRNRVLFVVGGGLHKRSAGGQKAIVDRMVTMARERFPVGLDARLPATDRPRAHLLRRGDRDALVRLSRFDGAGASLQAVLASSTWTEGRLDLAVTIRLVDEAGEPLLFRREGDRVLRVLPADLADVIPAELLDVTDEVPAGIAELTVRGRSSGVEWLLPGTGTVGLVEVDGGWAVEATVHGWLDPAQAAYGAALPDDVWGVIARLAVLGHARSKTVNAPDFVATPARTGGRVALAYSTAANNLAVDMSDQKKLGRLVEGAVLAVARKLPEPVERAGRSGLGRRIRAGLRGPRR